VSLFSCLEYTVRIWDHLYHSGYDARQAADAMNCSRRTAAQRLGAIHERESAKAGRTNRAARDVSRSAARPTADRASYPVDCAELAELIRRTGDEHTPRYDRQRNLLASGMPYADITPRDGHSRADADLSAAQRYHDRLTP
jgi:hypothetical protein